MTEVSLKKVLRTIKASNKLEVACNLPPISPKCAGSSFRAIPRDKSSILTLTDVTHRKTITFSDSVHYFKSTRKPTTPKGMPKANKTSQTLSFTSDFSQACIQEVSKAIEEASKPKPSKFMSKKKNLMINDFVQFEDEKIDNKENSTTLGLEEEIKENLVNKHVLHLGRSNGTMTSTASLIRKKNMTPKFKPNLMNDSIFNIPDMKLRKMTLEKHYQEFKKTKELDKANEMKNNVIFNLGEDSNILSCCYDHDDYYLAFGSDDSIIRVYKAGTNKLEHCLSDPENYGVPITCIKFKPICIDPILLSCRVNGVVSLWDIEKNQRLASLKEENYVYTCEYSRDGGSFATAGYDTKIRIYDQSTMQLISVLQKDEKNNEKLGHTNRIYGLKCWAEHPEILLSGGWDETVFIWDTRVGHSVEYIYGPLVCGDSLDIRGECILTGSWRNHHQLQIWDVRNKKNHLDIFWENLSSEEANKRNKIYTAQFNKNSDEYIIAGTTGANEIRIFEKGQNYICTDVITGVNKPIYSLNFNNLDQKIAFSSGNGICGVIEL